MTLTEEQLAGMNISTHFHISDELWNKLQKQKKMRKFKKSISKFIAKIKECLKLKR